MVSGNMKKYEKQLKTLQKLSNNGCDPVHQSETDLSEADARLLSAKGLVILHPAGDNRFFITLTDAGITYFSDLVESRVDFFKNHFANFLTGFLSGALAGVVGTLLVQRFTQWS